MTRAMAGHPDARRTALDAAREGVASSRGHLHTLGITWPLIWLEEFDEARQFVTWAAEVQRDGGFHSLYASSNAAMVALMQSLATELGPHGIRVNAILPGHDAGPRASPRHATLDDVAALALFLCSPAARRVTGQAVRIAGHPDAA